MTNEDPKGDSREIFKYMSLAYDVTAAKALVEGLEAGAEVEPLKWRDWISREIACGESRRMLTLGIGINHAHVPTVDLESPIIVARFIMPHDEAVIPIPIDGWHRIQRAINENVEKLPAYYLTLEQSEKVRIR